MSSIKTLDKKIRALSCSDYSSLVGLSGLEPPTPTLSGWCSNRLSYKPSFIFFDLNGFGPLSSTLDVRKYTCSVSRWCSNRLSYKPSTFQYKAGKVLYLNAVSLYPTSEFIVKCLLKNFDKVFACAIILIAR